MKITAIEGVHASPSQPNTLIQAGHVLPMEGPGLGTELLPAVFERADLRVRRSEA